jgi:hypothetical protein
MTGRFRKFTTSLVLQVFWDDNVSVVKNAVFPNGSVCQYRLTAAGLMFKNSLLLNRLLYQDMEIAVGNRKECSITIVLGSRSDSRHVSARIVFSDCYSQSSQIWHRCQKSSFWSSWWIQGWTPVVVFQHHDGAFILVCSRALYHWLPDCVGITLKAPSTPLNHMVNPPTPFAHYKGLLSYHSLLLFCYANGDLDNPTLAQFGPVTPPYPNMAMPCPKDTCHNPSKLSHDALFLMCEAKSWVGSDWLISSSKLQLCLELCWFAQVPLKTKVARWKVHFLLKICEKPLCNIH